MSTPEQISFFLKNFADYTCPNVICSASEGSAYAPNVQRRSNYMGWGTTGSVDANDTTFTVNFGDLVTLTDLILVLHNFKSFTIQYWNGSAFVDFSTVIAPTNCTDTTSHFSFTSVQTTILQLTILGTQVANTDKLLCQFIATQLIGQLNGWPVIASPTFDLNQRVNVMLSGKKDIENNAGGFSTQLTVSNWSNAADLTTIETLYQSGEGFLLWLCGGNQTQFSSVRKGYRLQDIFLCKCEDVFVPEWVQGLYTTGMKINMKVSECTN